MSTGPFGGYTANAKGDRFIECDYWSGPDDARVLPRAAIGQGPGVPASSSISPKTRSRRSKSILHRTSARAAAVPRTDAARTIRHESMEMHISEIGFCTGHSASGVWVNEQCRAPPCRAFTPPATWRACGTNYMLGAFTDGVGSHRREPDLPQAAIAASMRARSALRTRTRAAPRRTRRRYPAAPVRIQAAPHGERLSAAAEGHPQDASSACAASPRCGEDMRSAWSRQPA